MSNKIQLRTYYALCPGGHFRVENAPADNAAFDLIAKYLGFDAAHSWPITSSDPGTHCFGVLDWVDEAEEAWLAFDGWPELVTILTGEECGFDNRTLCVALTAERGPLTAAVLRIASNYIDGALGAAEKAASAGVSGAQDAYNAITEDVAEWLWSEARAWEQARPGDALPGGQVVAVLGSKGDA